MLQPDARLQQRYRIVRQLKQGGMGTVYEAFDERLDVEVALKECHFDAESLRRQFEREARLLARLRHPVLTKVIDHFNEGAGQFLVMEFIPGFDLSEMLQAREAPFPQAEVLAWASQLLDALDYLHTQQPPVIHRDIKPQNLKLTARGQIILLDFGLAKGYGGHLSRINTTGSIFGYTPTYAPLEQIQGAGTDARSDLYSLAATLYHLLTLTPPPDALTRVTEVTNERPDPLRPVSDINPLVSKSVSEVIRRAMSQNRERRPGSASEMRALLCEAAAGSGAETSDATTHVAPSTAPPAGPRAKPLAARERDDARASYEDETVAAAHAARHQDRRAHTGGGPRRDAPIFSAALTEPAASSVRWGWWTALTALGLLAVVALSVYVTLAINSLSASNPAVTPANTNSANTNVGNMNGANSGWPTLSPGAVPTLASNSRAAAVPTPWTATPTPSPTQRPQVTQNANVSPDAPPVIVQPPPPVIVQQHPMPTPTPRRTAAVSGGVLNSKAISKPQPSYPPIAKAARASGTVTVQVLVNEEGQVVSASAVSGHPLLQQAAVAAARQARFSPTILSGQPVKVSGVVTYNFALQ